MTPSLGLIICSNDSQKSGKHVYWFIIKDVMKGTDEQPDEEIHRVRSGRVLSIRALVLWSWGCVTLLAHRYVHQPRSSLNPVTWGFLWRVHHIGMIDY